MNDYRPSRRVVSELTIYGRTCHVMDHLDDAPAAPVEMCITEAALGKLLTQIGDHLPEAGSFMFGPAQLFGTDVAEKDFIGSRPAASSFFIPDTKWASGRLRYWVDQPGPDQRLLTGICHSHPLSAENLSHKTGPGLGDLGYAEAVFDAVPAIQHLAMPVFTNTGKGRLVQIHPWLVQRDDPTIALGARLRVCSSAEFPVRQFNPGAEPPANPSSCAAAACPVDLERLARYVGGTAHLGPPAPGWITIDLQLRCGGVKLSVGLAPGFPAKAPDVLVATSSDRLVAAPFQWDEESPGDVTRRLADLCLEVASLARSRF